MSHYEERLEKDLAHLRSEVVGIGEAVQRAVADAVHALLQGDRDLAARTALGDLPINRRVRRLDHDSHVFVVRHLPSAGHLRFVSSVLRLSLGLERIGDYAVTIAREAVQLDAPPPAAVVRDIELLASNSGKLLEQAMQAFAEMNADLARGTKSLAAQTRTTFDKVFADLLAEGERKDHSLRDLFALLGVINKLERVADQAKNVCDETVFAVTGKMKKPKVYRVVFVDERDDRLTQVAVAHGRKNFSDKARFESAGWSPAAGLDEGARDFLDDKGYDTSDLRPSSLGDVRLDDIHVVVCLGGDPWENLPRIPFQTAVLTWDAGNVEALTESQRFLAQEIAGLVDTLRGEE